MCVCVCAGCVSACVCVCVCVCAQGVCTGECVCRGGCWYVHICMGVWMLVPVFTCLCMYVFMVVMFDDDDI